MTKVSLWQTLKSELNLKFFVFALLIALVYSALSVYLLNFKLVITTITGDFALGYKIKLLSALLGGIWTAFSFMDFLFLIIISLFVGVNILLMIHSVKAIREQGSLKFAFGGGTLLGVVSAGCTSCGFSVLSLLGLAAFFAYFPIVGVLLHLLVILLLLFSIFYNLKTLKAAMECEV